MPVIERYKTGMFSWADLATTDLESAKRFYSELFGWKLEDMPTGDAGAYTMARRDGEDVGGLSGMMPGMREQGIPPHWMAYFWVDDVDARASKVAALGGKLVMPPMDVMDVGRMCIIEDPTGAKAALWQERKHKGAGVKNEPGSLAWVELLTQDTAKAQVFYTQLLGWTPKTQQVGPTQYTSFFVGESPAAGMVKPDVNTPSSWSIYFAVEDCDQAVERATQRGAQVQQPAQDIPSVGRFALLKDPQGAFFSLIQFKS